MKHNRFCQTVNINFLFSVAVLVLLSGCGAKKIDLEAYYYPIGKLKHEGLVYEYKSDNINMAPSFWYYAAEQIHDTTLLLGQNLNQQFEVTQLTVERKVKNGMLLMSNRIFIPDSTGKKQQVDVEILQKNLYPFSVSDTNGIFLYKVKWISGKDKHTTVIRNRRFLGFADLVYKNKPIKCAKFEVKERIEDFKEGYIEYPFHGFEYYGLNIGLLKLEKIVNANLKLSYYLNDILTVDEFEKRYNTGFDPAKAK
jgi:hypothetical protein